MNFTEYMNRQVANTLDEAIARVNAAADDPLDMLPPVARRIAYDPLRYKEIAAGLRDSYAASSDPLTSALGYNGIGAMLAAGPQAADKSYEQAENEAAGYASWLLIDDEPAAWNEDAE